MAHEANLNDPCALGALQLSAAIRRGEISAQVATEAHIARMQRENPRLNALVVERFAAALAEARAIDQRRAAGEALGPLAGVPVTIKECLDLAGTASTFGVVARRGALAASDEKHVARLRRAGAIVLGKSNVGQLLLMFESDNPLFGRTVHPLDPERSPGGSSGGEAALLASHASALGLGTDIGGSSRVPAAFCGIVGLKPTAGRCDDLGRGSVPLGQRTIASQVGVLARSVEDVALGLGVINGGVQPELDGTLAPAMPLMAAGDVDLSRLRIAYYTDDGTFTPAPAARRGVAEAARMFEARGARVEAWEPPDVWRARDLFFSLLAADNFAGCRRVLGKSKRDRRIANIEMAARHKRLVDIILAFDGHGRLKREIVSNYGHGDTDHYFQCVEAVLDYRERFARAFAGYDAVLCPTASLPAFRHGAAEELVAAGAYTCLYNVLGWPACSVPITRVRPGEESDRPASHDKMDRAASATERGSAGLPIGVQIAARPWREDIVLAVAQAIEVGVRA